MLNKRALGIGNLALRRAKIFRQELAPYLAERISDVDPDWYLFSGDFTTTSLKPEFDAASEFLRPYIESKPGKIIYVTGNHDRYLARDHRSSFLEKALDWVGPGHRWPIMHEIAKGVHAIGIDGTTPNGMGSFGKLTAAAKSGFESVADGD